MRILLVDDHALFRRGMRELLSEHGLEIAGEASNGEMGVRLARELRPEVVVMDLHMPVMGGVEATRAIVEERLGAKVIVLTMSVEDADVVEAIIAGAAGYLLKDADVEEIVAGIRAAADGASAIAPSAATALVQRVREREHEAEGGQATLEAAPVELSDREREVLKLVAEGLDNRAIGEQLHLSPSTVKTHISSIFEKLGVDSRVQAAVYAVRTGLA